MSNYIFKIDGSVFTPRNIGELNLSVALDKEAGSYQYVQSLDGELLYYGSAYDYITSCSECQKITVEIINKCGRLEIELFKGYFSKSDGEINRTDNTFKVTPTQDSYYNCLTNALDVEFNLLQTPQIVSSQYAAVPELEFRVPNYSSGGVEPFYGSEVLCPSTATPFFGFSLFVREVVLTPCQGGEPQQPSGTGWELLENRCEQGLSKWVRKAAQFDTISCGSGEYFDNTYTVGGTIPTPPPVAGRDYYLMDTVEVGTFGRAFWIDYNEIVSAYGGIIELNNGRNLVDVINYGLNQVCPELDLQSLFLTSDENPVTGKVPSSSKDIQIHSISDIRNPNADLPATIETTTLRTILEQWCTNSLNCFWFVDENTRRLIVEHYVDLDAYGVTQVTNKVKDVISYDSTNKPLQEVFESTEIDADFKGVPIEYDNGCTQEPKQYNRASIYTDVQAILNNPDSFSDDGLVFILPESLAPVDSINPNGSRSENGVITGLFRPNAPLAMANLQDKFWKQNRPFTNGTMNFIDTEFEKEPNVLGATISYPTCCIGKFAPYSSFTTFQSDDSRLESATINLLNSTIEIQTRF